VTSGSSRLTLGADEYATLVAGITDMVEEYLAQVQHRPVFPSALVLDDDSLLTAPLPTEPVPVAELLADCRKMLDQSRHNGHPRFFGYVASPASPVGVYADLLASALNANVTSWRSAPSATRIERNVLGWLAELTQFPAADGVLTSGGSLANLTAVLLASRRALGPIVAREGLRGSQSLTMYVSEEAHHSLAKAADMLGIGTQQVRHIPSDSEYRMDIDALRQALTRDTAAGHRPFLVVGTAGATNTGAVDPLATIGEVAREYSCWFHVDGAYGAPAVMVEELQPMFVGLDRADSLTLDPHKWMYVPLDCGALLLRDANAAPGVFAASSSAAYIDVAGGGADEETFAFWDHTLELSRRFRALKVWLVLRAHGTAALAAALREDCRLARVMANAVNSDADLELVAPSSLSVCCFRAVPASHRGDEQALDVLNAAVLREVQSAGTAYLSGTAVGGRTALRACITNFRTTETDIAATLDEVRRATREVMRG
jgi:aromatic-L-amino-acid/L-tryptophan decarboxylase